jgi:hypothetical protein
MSYATVDNKLVDIRRKSGESLHDLYDRVTALARRADYTARERAFKERNAFFQALRTDSDLQHYVGRPDKADPPSIDVTLALAMQYEMTYGRKDRTDTSSAKQVSATPCDDTDATSESVNRLQFTSLKAAKDPVIRQLCMQQNEMVELMKKQYKLFEQHLAPDGSSAPRTSGYKKNTSSTSTPKPGSSFHRKAATHSKPSGNWKNKKPAGKGFKPRAKVHQVEEEEQPEEGEYECEEEEEEQPPDEYEQEAPEEH